MRRLSSLLFLTFAVLLSACAMQRAQDAETAQRRMVGMSKEQVFACMGLPKRKGAEGNTEIWSYYSGNYRTDKSKTSGSLSRSGSRKSDDIAGALSASVGIGDEVKESRYCIVQFVINDGRVRAVNYSGPTGGFLTEDEQCAFAMRNCLPR